jgi:glycosyltransferase involved in cell wall biosynthesis
LLVESLKQNFLHNCDGFVVPGKSALEYMQQGGVSPAKVFVAPNAVDNDLFSAREQIARGDSIRLRGELALPGRYFLFVGRLVKAKGVVDLLEAYGSLDSELRSRVGLVFAGDGAMRAELEALSRSIFPGAVHFPGFVHRDELASYYALGECLVLPTHSDTWGLVVNEAMACGLPVICTDVAGCAADLVKSNGHLVAARNPRQLADAMQEIATDPELRGHMSRESRKLVQEYSPNLCATGISEAAWAMQRRATDNNVTWSNQPASTGDISQPGVGD